MMPMLPSMNAFIASLITRIKTTSWLSCLTCSAFCLWIHSRDVQQFGIIRHYAQFFTVIAYVLAVIGLVVFRKKTFFAAYLAVLALTAWTVLFGGFKAVERCPGVDFEFDMYPMVVSADDVTPERLAIRVAAVERLRERADADGFHVFHSMSRKAAVEVFTETILKTWTGTMRDFRHHWVIFYTLAKTACESESKREWIVYAEDDAVIIHQLFREQVACAVKYEVDVSFLDARVYRDLWFADFGTSGNGAAVVFARKALCERILPEYIAITEPGYDYSAFRFVGQLCDRGALKCEARPLVRETGDFSLHEHVFYA